MTVFDIKKNFALKFSEHYRKIQAIKISALFNLKMWIA